MEHLFWSNIKGFSEIGCSWLWLRNKTCSVSFWLFENWNMLVLSKQDSRRLQKFILVFGKCSLLWACIFGAYSTLNSMRVVTSLQSGLARVRPLLQLWSVLTMTTVKSFTSLPPQTILLMKRRCSLLVIRGLVSIKLSSYENICIE